jgi:hypothetical protein
MCPFLPGKAVTASVIGSLILSGVKSCLTPRTILRLFSYIVMFSLIFIGLPTRAIENAHCPQKPPATGQGRTATSWKQGEDYEPVEIGAESLAGCTYRKRSPLGALVRRARGSMRDAMSPRESRSLHTRRRLLPIAICGQDRLLLLMESITLPSVKRYLGMNCEEVCTRIP